MRLVPRLRTKLQLFLLVESSFFMIGLAILFTLVSLVQPFWSFSRTVGVNHDIGVALFALFYPIVAIPGAATTDIGTFTVGGFWGSAEPSSGMTWSWGPGLGWWLLLVGVVLGVGGAVLPYLKSLRAMVPSATVMRPAP